MGLVRKQVALRLAPALKERIQELPHQSYEQKQSLAKWVNSELRDYGLAIAWKVPGQSDGQNQEERTHAASLFADVGNHPMEGRFQIRFRDEHGKVRCPFSTPNITVLLERFELMLDDPDRSHPGKWAVQVHPIDAQERPRVK